MVSLIPNYEKQRYVLNSNDDHGDIEFHNGDVVYLMDVRQEIIFSEEDNQWYPVPTGGGGISIDGLCMATEPSGEVVINATQITSSWPYHNNVITKIIARNITGELPNNCFEQMTNLEYAVFPACAGNIGAACYSRCSNMLGIDLKGGGTLGSLCFAFCTKLTTMVLRNINTIQAVSQSNVFNGTISTTKPLHVYVPSALKSSYESATNWSAWMAEDKIVFHAIEGSIYETQYVDGTPIPTT